MIYEDAFASGLLVVDTDGVWAAFTGRRDQACAEAYKRAHGTVPHAACVERIEQTDASYDPKFD